MAFGSPQWMYSSGEDFTIDQSLRFSDGDSAYLSRTPTSSGTRTKWTYSGWVKRASGFGSARNLQGTGDDYNAIRFETSNTLRVTNFNDGSPSYNLVTTRLFRDSSAFYHIFVAMDTTQGTASNRLKLYINGVQETSFSTETYPAEDYEDNYSEASRMHQIGCRFNNSGNPTQFFDGYLAEVNFIDGQALTPADFGETGTYGEWKPIEYTGTYGTNGFYLPFKQDYEVEGFSATKYPGSGVTGQHIGGVGFQPDLVWVKRRNASERHLLTTPLHTVSSGAYHWNDSATNEAEFSGGTGVGSFDTDGFTFKGTDATWNASGNNYISYCWDMGGSTVSNTEGSITSSVRANPTYGQSIVTWTGTGSNATVGHGLDSAPDYIIVRNRDSNENWSCMVKYSYGGGEGFKTIYKLNTDAAYNNSNNTQWWQNTAPTSDVFYIGTNDAVNQSGDKFIAYCFHRVTGYMHTSYYIGNSGTKFNNVGFKPALVIIKKVNPAENWYLYDNIREHPDSMQKPLTTNNDSGEGGNSSLEMTFQSNGFTLTGDNSGVNTNAKYYSYMAFADNREYAYWLDQSGNNNDWTSNNLTESDIMLDTPTNNFATINPVSFGPASSGEDAASYEFLREGNLWLKPEHNEYCATTMMPTTGKWYVEALVKQVSPYGPMYGWTTESLANKHFYGDQPECWKFYSRGASDQFIWYDEDSATDPTLASSSLDPGEILQFAWDCDTGKMWHARDEVWYNSTLGTTGNPATGANPTATATAAQMADNFGLVFGSGDEYGGDSEGTQYILNFGQDSSFAGNKTAKGNQDSNEIGDFYYTPPTGFLALCTSNLPDVDVVPSKHFNTVLWTGTDSTRSITGVGFQPDFLWIKKRSSGDHGLWDSIRGVSSRLRSNTTAAEGSNAMTSFDSDGFTLPGSMMNNDTVTFVGWNWKAASTASGTTTGSGTGKAYSARYNTDAGFSMVTYKGNGTSGHTIPHHLSIAPRVVIVKSIDSASPWAVLHLGMGHNGRIQLNTTGQGWNDNVYWMADPTSSVFELATTTDVNGNNTDYIAYIWHDVDGYSKMGSYKGIADADGTFIYLGFRPKYFMIKASTTTDGWVIYDSARDSDGTTGFNKGTAKMRLFADGDGGETEIGTLDFLSNGVKIRASGLAMNEAHTYIYMAFAETPFKYSNAK